GDAVHGTRDPQYRSADHGRYEGRGARARIAPQALPLAATRRVDPLGRARCLPDDQSEAPHHLLLRCPRLHRGSGTDGARTARGRAERLSDRDDRDRLQTWGNAGQVRGRRGDGVLRRSAAPGRSREASRTDGLRDAGVNGAVTATLWGSVSALLRDRDRYGD